MENKCNLIHYFLKEQQTPKYKFKDHLFNKTNIPHAFIHTFTSILSAKVAVGGDLLQPFHQQQYQKQGQQERQTHLKPQHGLPLRLTDQEVEVEV